MRSRLAHGSLGIVILIHLLSLASCTTSEILQFLVYLMELCPTPISCNIELIGYLLGLLVVALGSSTAVSPSANPNEMKTYNIPSTITEPAFRRSSGIRPAAQNGSPAFLVLSEAFSDIGIYDTKTGAPIATVPVKGNPFDLVIAPGQSTLYAVVYPSDGSGANSVPPSVAVIDGRSWTLAGSISLPTGTYPQYAAISPDGSTLYVNNAAPTLGPTPNAPTSILVIDTASRTVKSTISLPSSVNAGLFGSYQRLQVSPDGTLLYAVGTNVVEAIDTLTLLPVSVIGFNPGIFPETSFPEPHIQFSSDGTAAYVVVAGPRGPAAAVINTATSQVTNLISVGSASSYLTDISVSPDGSILLAYDKATAALYPINTVTGQVGSAVSVPKALPNQAALLSNGQ
jgi:hypothetical protein